MGNHGGAQSQGMQRPDALDEVVVARADDHVLVAPGDCGQVGDVLGERPVGTVLTTATAHRGARPGAQAGEQTDVVAGTDGQHRAVVASQSGQGCSGGERVLVVLGTCVGGVTGQEALDVEEAKRSTSAAAVPD
jgi:hypothetical protein